MSPCNRKHVDSQTLPHGPIQTHLILALLEINTSVLLRLRQLPWRELGGFCDSQSSVLKIHNLWLNQNNIGQSAHILRPTYATQPSLTCMYDFMRLSGLSQANDLHLGNPFFDLPTLSLLPIYTLDQLVGLLDEATAHRGRYSHYIVTGLDDVEGGRYKYSSRSGELLGNDACPNSPTKEWTIAGKTPAWEARDLVNKLEGTLMAAATDGRVVMIFRCAGHRPIK